MYLLFTVAEFGITASSIYKSDNVVFLQQQKFINLLFFCSEPELRKITENESASVELEPYVKKLNNSRRRVMLVNSILQNVQVI